MTEQQSTPTAEGADSRTLYTAFELGFVLDLDPTESAAISREEMSLTRAPEDAQAYVQAVVTSGLRARGKVQPGQEGQWLLGEELQVIASALTRADRWLGMALAEGPAMRVAYIMRAGSAVLMFTQDELDTYLVSVLESSDAVPEAVANVSRSFLTGGEGRTVSLRRVALETKDTITQMMFHAEDDGAFKIAHNPVTAEGELTVSDISADQFDGVLTRLWDDGVSAAPQQG